MAEGTRDSIIEAYKGNALEPLRAIVNVQVLTTGFNVPQVDFLALCRPTESVGLYVQMVGRGTRIAAGKSDCLVADYAGLTLRHGPIDAVDPLRAPYSEEGGGIPPAKECPVCMTIILAGLRLCPICGHEFPPPAPMLLETPSEAPILKGQEELAAFDIDETTYDVHAKPGKPLSVKITYWAGMSTIPEWIFPESSTQWGDFYYRKTCREMGLAEPYPRTAAEFVARWDLPQAVKIWTIPEGKFSRVKRHEWRAKAFEDAIPF
jgi:DNA repair protein RadD